MKKFLKRILDFLFEAMMARKSMKVERQEGRKHMG